MENVNCLIPAAGRSSRMGQWKLMLPFGDKTVIETVVATPLSVCSKVVLVTGYRSPELQDLFEGVDRVAIIENVHWQAGMFSSIRRGASAIESDQFFIALADMPLLDPKVFRKLLHASHGKNAAGETATVAYAPVFDGKRGHPVLLSRIILDKIRRANSETTTMKEIIRQERVHEVAWSDDSIHRDLDTPDEYQAMLQRSE